MNATLRSIISFVVSVICMALVYLSMHTYEINPKGVVLPTTDKIYPPYQGNVTIYSSLTAPFNEIVIGKISIEYHNVHFTPDAENKVIEKAKYLAAQSGGNGLIISTIGHSVKSTPSFMQVIAFQGTVIKTNKQVIQ